MTQERAKIPNPPLTQTKILELDRQDGLDVLRVDCEVNRGAQGAMRGRCDVLVALDSMLEILRNTVLFARLQDVPYIHDPKRIILSYPVGWPTPKLSSGSRMAVRADE